MENLLNKIIGQAKIIGFTEVGSIDIEKLEFEQWVRDICKNSCRYYNKSWACPPAAGTLEECKARCFEYKHFVLFNFRSDIEDSYDWDGMMAAMQKFKELSEELEAFVKPITEKCLLLTSGRCEKCEKCTCPDAPCRFPEQLHHSLEGYGFNVSKLAEMGNMHYIGGKDTITYFGAILFK